MSAAASLLDVAIRALVQSGAPRRTIAATAAAMASVLLADMRGGAHVRGGASAPPSAAQQRRKKRKVKAAKEKAVLVPAIPRSGDDGDQGTGLGEGFTAEPTSAVASDLIVADGLSPLAPPDVTPHYRCVQCSQNFVSRNSLFRHLRQSGHAEFSAPSSLDDADSASGVLPLPAANLSVLPPPQPPPDLERQTPLPPPWQHVAPLRLEQGGGLASSSAVSTALRVVDVPAPHGPAKHGKSRKGPYR